MVTPAREGNFLLVSKPNTRNHYLQHATQHEWDAVSTAACQTFLFCPVRRKLQDDDATDPQV